MLYHASQTPGLLTLQPRASTHGAAYVYAVRTRLTALLFGAPKDDFDLLTDEENGLPVVWECWPGALRAVYGGRGCSLYTVDEAGFFSGRTGWEPELVCPGPVPVLREERIADLYACLFREQAAGGCVLHRYAAAPAYRAFLRRELAERVRAFGLTPQQMAADERFARWHLALLKAPDAGQDPSL